MHINKPIKWGSLLGFLILLLACSNKMNAEKSIKPLISVPSYHKNEPFVCQYESSTLWLKVAPEANLFFEQAERLMLEDVPLEEKIVAYERAVQLHHPKALDRILQLYRVYSEEAITKRSGKEKSRQSYQKEIVNTYKRILDEQLPVGYAYLAQLKKEGKLLYKDEKKAYNYMVLGSKQGNPKAQAMLGNYYFYNQGEYEKGVKAHNCAVIQGNKDSYHELAVAATVFEENYPKSLKLHVTAANNGSLKSLVLLRSVFRDGLYGYDKDPELMMCFQHFINAYSATPQDIRELDEACPLPDHPDLGKGDKPIDAKKRKEIEIVEKKFNPQKELSRKDKEDEEDDERHKKSRLLKLKKDQSRF